MAHVIPTVVRPVEQRRDARVDGFERPEEVPRVGVLGAEVPAQAGVQPGQVVKQRLAPQQRFRNDTDCRDQKRNRECLQQRGNARFAEKRRRRPGTGDRNQGEHGPQRRVHPE